MTGPGCPHGSADPRLCMECRRARVGGRPMPGYDAADLADAVAPARLAELDQLGEVDAVDHALALSEDLQRTLGRFRYVAFTWEDAAALYRAATRHRAGGRLAREVSARVAAALTEAFATEPGLRPDAGNAVPPAETKGDHGEQATTLTNPTDPTVPTMPTAPD